MTTITESPTLANGLATLEFARDLLNKLIEACPDDKLVYQPCGGANHVLWNMGHIAMTDEYFATAVGGRDATLPAEWGQLFGMGSIAQPDASAYPSHAELTTALAERRAALIDWFSSLSDEQLAEPLPEKLAMFGPSVGALMSTIAAHEALHAGQITVIRKSLGLEPAFG